MLKKLQRKEKFYNACGKFFDSSILLNLLILLAVLPLPVVYYFNTIYNDIDFMLFLLKPILKSGVILISSVIVTKLIAGFCFYRSEVLNSKITKLCQKNDNSKRRKSRRRENLQGRRKYPRERRETKGINNLRDVTYPSKTVEKHNPIQRQTLTNSKAHLFIISSKNLNIIRNDREEEWNKYLEDTIIDNESIKFIRELLYTFNLVKDSENIGKVFKTLILKDNALAIIEILVYFSINGEDIKLRWNELYPERKISENILVRKNSN